MFSYGTLNKGMYFSFITKFYLSGLRLDNFLEFSVLASSKLMDIDNKKKMNPETDLAFIV